ncbi:MAG: hypothetical protein EPN98_21730 [Phenylobacterium sp.]|uniref:hypothetical protein n=1 Tax=Phenylobacterium sp. TaxID=1871053 RepID=UPI001222A0CE|nr:hypothetical protein [Phenylobacterium sp.]TAL29065.1 MAG: hypothetical protein EPN98_21730 [Phenylobacterium sp.]
MTISARNRFVNDLAMIQKTLEILANDIDNLGELAFTITHDERGDQLGCYASNSLQGTMALLRDMGRLVERSARPTSETERFRAVVARAEAEARARAKQKGKRR